jgi:hypothetical protein
MSIDPNRCLALGTGFRGGPKGSVLQITFVKCNSKGFRLHINGQRILFFISAYHNNEIISQSTVKDNGDGTFNCVYRSPEKRGNYKLSIEIDGKPACGSPCPIFFSNHNKTSLFPKEERKNENGDNDISEYTKAAVKTASRHLQKSSGYDPSTTHLHLSIQATLQHTLAESTVVKAFDVSPLITIRKLHEIFSLYGNPQSVDIVEQGGKCNAYIKFKTVTEADKSLIVSGTFIGDRDLQVEKWYELSSAPIARALPLTNRDYCPIETR